MPTTPLTPPASISPFSEGDVLIPLTDAWDSQTLVHVIGRGASQQFIRDRADEIETLAAAPSSSEVHVRPRLRTPEYDVIRRVENVLAREIDQAGSRLKLEMALARVGNVEPDPATAEAIVRYLVGRGDFVATVSGKRTKIVRLSLSPVGRARENHRTYASSFAHELGIQAEQIGRLIGHGPTVGGEREELLRALIERHVPTRFHVATGFVEGSARQIDILIYDQIDFAPLFRTGNLVVVPIEAVRALIEVKSSLTSDALADALVHLEEARGFQTSGPPIFRGVFGYQGATAKTLISALVERHREPDDFYDLDEDGPHQVYSIYDMVDAVCVLRQTVLVTDFITKTWAGRTAPSPYVMELGSEAGRESQAALFFDRLLHYLRHPFPGGLNQAGYGARFGTDIATTGAVPLYPERDWGPYMIDTGIERVEAQIAARRDWLNGNVWVEAPPDTD